MLNLAKFKQLIKEQIDNEEGFYKEAKELFDDDLRI
jgi:hypothetical protein